MSASTVYVNGIAKAFEAYNIGGKELNFVVYNIGGNNFFKLRDLMEAIDVYVGYDNTAKSITLDTSKGYVAE